MSGQRCENYDVKRETVHCYPRNVDRCCTSFVNNVIICFPPAWPICFVYNKSLNDWSLGEQWILFPSNLNVSLDFVSGNIEILGKQNSLFPSAPVIKYLLKSIKYFRSRVISLNESLGPILENTQNCTYCKNVFKDKCPLILGTD